MKIQGDLKYLPRYLGVHAYWTKSQVESTILHFITFFCENLRKFAWGRGVLCHILLPPSSISSVCIYYARCIAIHSVPLFWVLLHFYFKLFLICLGLHNITPLPSPLVCIYEERCLTIHSVGGLQYFEAVDVSVLVEVVVPEMLHDYLRLAQALNIDVLLVNVRL